MLKLFAKLLRKIKPSSTLNCELDITSSVGGGSFLEYVKLGRYSYCGYRCNIINCEIGSFCSIADDVYIGGSQHDVGKVSTTPLFYADSVIGKAWAIDSSERIKKSTLGHDVWVGSRVMIKAGVNVGTGSVLGMGSVVTKNIPPYEIWGGNPARKLKDRFDPITKNKLLSSKWWEWDRKELSKLACYTDDPIKFLSKIDN